jgi:hypothetical protein
MHTRRTVIVINLCGVSKNDFPTHIKPMNSLSLRYGLGKKLPLLGEYEPDFKKKFHSSMKQTETMHWNYLDNYNAKNARIYPYLRMNDFMNKLCIQHGMEISYSTIKDYVRRYNKYKKSLPTAGVIMYYKDPDNGHIHFPVVKITRAPIFSMPKGKQDGDAEPITRTAIREFHEETGIDLDGFINDTTPSASISKTT